MGLHDAPAASQNPDTQLITDLWGQGEGLLLNRNEWGTPDDGQRNGDLGRIAPEDRGRGGFEACLKFKVFNPYNNRDEFRLLRVIKYNGDFEDIEVGEEGSSQCKVLNPSVRPGCGGFGEPSKGFWPVRD